MMLFGKEITEPIDLVAGLPPDHDSVNTVPEYVMHMRDHLELSHQLAREALGKSLERAKRHYNKNICQIQHKVGDAVWYLVKGTKRVKNQVRKFLPSYEGPYFVVGLLDDLVYRIKKSSRAKAKVVHHDKLKPGPRWTTAGDLAVETPQGHSSPPRGTPSTSQLHHEPPQPQVAELEQPVREGTPLSVYCVMERVLIIVHDG
ncbi:hypothetical protein L3Q82_003878 [Scortum barcoo]|nr:hypothetical protein L3Q82_003878 [Scortum barcoo]